MVRGSILLLLFVALLGCQPESDSIRIGSNRWLGYAPIYLADDLGWTAPSGIRLVEYPNTTGVLRGFRNGMLDAAMLTLDETLLLQDSAAELDLEIILVTNVSAGADALFARAPLTNLKDLAGQRIGVENTALGAYFLSRVLDQAGLRIDDLQVVSLPVHEQAPPPSPPAKSTLSSPSLRRARRWKARAPGASSTAASCRARSSTYWWSTGNASPASSVGASGPSGSMRCAPGRTIAAKPIPACMRAWA